MEQRPKKYLQVSDDFKERLAKRQKLEDILKVDEEWQLIAEFGKYYGWPGVMAVLNDEISGEVMNMLLTASRKLDTRDQYNASAGVFTAVASANSKKPGDAFKKNTKNYLKDMGVK